MEKERFIITGISRLTGSRETVSCEMKKETAVALLEQVKKNRRCGGYHVHIRLRIERVQPVQLSLDFNENVPS